ncbi:MAG: hypothetical protein HYX44_15470, partial [Aquabacterium sp.]|nr:hypothetical protein [Aquabacterium sp.]
MIGAIATGTCPTSNFTDNYLYMQFNSGIDLTASDRDFFGVFDWNVNTGSGQSTSQYKMDYATVSYPTPITGTCTNGVMTTTNFKAYLAPGAACVKIIQ